MTAKHLGRYEILETLGRGSMGVVYKAHDPLIERIVAIKTISYTGLTPTEARDFEQRFFLEAKSAGRLSHPNIVIIHDVGHADGQAYIAMEFLSGQSLRTILDSGVVLSTRQIAKVAHHVASGLAFAHANGVIHRDIKPANIMVPESGQVKITDFGIALLPSGSMTLAGTAVGSPKYMSPEQVLGHKADRRSDIFSLGAVLYEMLTGTPPFAGPDLNAILYQVLNAAPALPSDMNASLPPAFDRIVARALAKDPDKRYQSAEEMAADLRNYRKLPGLMHGNATVATELHSDEENNEDTHVPTAQPVIADSKYSTWRLAAPLLALASLAVSVYLWFAPASQTASTPVAAVVEPMRQAAASETAMPAKSASTRAPAATVQAPPPGKRPAADKPVRQDKKDNDKKTVETPVAAVVREQPKPSVADWKSRLHADIAACDNLSFFSRIACREKAVWKHCPGHWGATELCPQGNQ